MLRLQEIKLPLDHPPAALTAAVLARLGIGADELVSCTVFRRGCDARQRNHIALIYAVDVAVRNEAAVRQRLAHDHRVTLTPTEQYHFPVTAPAGLKSRPVIIGMGPCGLLAGLVLAQNGFRPLLLERGKCVRERAVDTASFWRDGVLHPESNVQFGEGGAGTFSDGKLYSQIKDRAQRGQKVLDELVAAGALPEIKVASKPHIGTARLVQLVENLRRTIITLGGEVRFNSRVDELDIADGVVRGVVLASGERYAASHVIMAIGHSARDTFEMLHRCGVQSEPKPFAIGVRIEHPQALIDAARFGRHAGHPLLGAADYKLVHHCANGRTVYSFCMCPGGTVVGAASEAGGVVTNGMSQYARDAANANAALVVGIAPADYPGGPLAGIALQQRCERQAFVLGGGKYHAPCQLVGDFLAGRASTAGGAVVPSYQPGVQWGALDSCLPDYVVAALREALPAFDRQLPGFARPDAVLTGVETRTSSPVRLVRGDDCQSVTLRGLFPAGEGAGYAGGILSSAVDGIRVAEAVAVALTGAGGGPGAG